MSEERTRIIRDIRSALDAKVDASRELFRGGIEISEGRRTEKLGDSWIYHFVGNETLLPAVDDVDVRVKCKGLVTDGRLLARSKGKISISISRDIGIETPHALLYVDLGSYHTNTRKLLDVQTSPPMSAGKHLGLDLLGVTTTSVAWHSRLETWDGQTDQERQIFKSVASDSVTLVDCRSHTRRLQLLTKLVDALGNEDKRVLIVSALSTDLDRFVVRCHDRIPHRVTDGRLIRLGTVVEPSLRNEYAADNDVGAVTSSRDSADLARASQLRTSTQIVRASMRRIERVLSLFSEHKETKDLYDRLSHELKPHVVRLEDFRRELSKANKVVEDTSASLERAKSLSLVRRVAAGLKPVELLQKLRTVDNFRRRVRGQVDLLERSIAQKKIDCEEAGHTLRDLAELIVGLSESDLQTAYDSMSSRLEGDISQIEDIEARHDQLRKSIVVDARIVAATFSEMMAGSEGLGSFDVAVVLTAENHCVPELFSLAGLTSERLVVVSNFSQPKPGRKKARTDESTLWSEGTLMEAYAALEKNNLSTSTPHLISISSLKSRREKNYSYRGCLAACLTA